MRNTVVQFGAGNIGRGFMGQIYTEAGYEVVFVDVSEAMITDLNRRKHYPLRLVGPDRFETLEIGPVRAVSARDPEAVAAELATCAFACTAVGVIALPHLVPVLAEGIRRRRTPLNVILCENQLHCSDLLRGLLSRELPDACLEMVGLVESVVSRMVPVVPEAERRQDPLLAIAEDYPRLPVDRTAFVGDLPPVAALHGVEDFAAYVERKLYVHNLGHAVAAYLAYERGHQFLPNALAEMTIRDLVRGAMEETCEALARKHSLRRADLEAHRNDLLRRFANPALNDTVARVGRDPERKLRPDDRLIGAGLLCLDEDVEPRCVAEGIAAAFRFDPADDPSATAIQQELRQFGFGPTFHRLTGQRPDSELGRLVVQAWEARITGD